MRDYSVMHFEPELSLNRTETILRALSDGDLLKVHALRNSIPKKELYRSFYFKEVEKLNSLIEHIALLKSMKP